MKQLRFAYEYTMPVQLRIRHCQSAIKTRSGRAVLCALLVISGALALVSCDATIGSPIGDDPPGTVDAARPTPDAAVESDAASTPPDAAMPRPDAAPALTSCYEIYHNAPEYVLCQQLDFTCEFNVLTNGGNCDQMCSNYGGTCVAAYDNDNDPAVLCTRKEASGDDCSTLRSTEICVCSRY